MVTVGMDREVLVGVPGTLAMHLVGRFEAAARRAIAERGRFTCAVPGGSVAEAMLPALAAAPVDWSRVDVFWGDERAVPPGDPDSNYALARRLWLDHLPLDPVRVHRMPADGADLDAAADEYARDLGRTLGGRPLDFALLGMGADGHVCSLFPGHPALDEPTRTVVPIHDSPKPPPRRLTLTLVALSGTALACIAAFGSEKAAAAAEAVTEPASRLPVARALRAGAHALLLLDPAAASRLGSHASMHRLG